MIRSKTAWMLLAALAPAAVWAQAPGVTDKEIVIGACLPMSGPASSYGEHISHGAEDYLRALNAKGGVDGRKVRLSVGDDKYELEAGIACYHDRQAEGVFATSLNFASAILTKHVPMAEASKTPLVGVYTAPLFTVNPVHRYVFIGRPTYRDEMLGVIDHLWTDAGLRKFGVLYQEDAFGVDLLDGIKDGLKAKGAEIAGLGSYVRNVNNIDEAYAKIKAANPDVVFLAAVAVPAAAFVKKAHADGWHPLFVTNSGAGADVFAAKAGDDAEGVIGTECFPSLSRTDLPTVSQYLKAQKQNFPNEAPTLAGLRGYINMLVLTKGLSAVGKDLDREKLVDTLEKMQGVDVGLGADKLGFSPTDHTGLHEVYYTVVKGGKAVGFSDWKGLAKK